MKLPLEITAHEDVPRLNVVPRLLAIAMRRYTTSPDDRPTAARMLMLNAARLAIRHAGKKAAAQLFLQALSEDATR